MLRSRIIQSKNLLSDKKLFNHFHKFLSILKLKINKSGATIKKIIGGDNRRRCLREGISFYNSFPFWCEISFRKNPKSASYICEWELWLGFWKISKRSKEFEGNIRKYLEEILRKSK